MSKAFFDIETDGLNATRIHCICAMLDNDEPTVYNFIGENTYGNFREWLASENVDTLIGHNIINFDVPILRRLSGFRWDFNLRDTLVLSRLSNPSLEGGHSLRSWGERLGKYKDDYQGGWERCTREMVEYCRQDVRVTKALYEHLNEQEDTESAEIEHKTADIIKKQTDNGMLLDEKRAYELLAEMKEMVIYIEDEVHARFEPLPEWIPLNYPDGKTKNKDGSISKRYQAQLDKGASWQHIGERTGAGETQWGYYLYPEFNLGSRQQIGRYLQHFGWKPKEFTDKGNVIVNESVLTGVDMPEAQQIAEYLMLQKRVAQVQSWVDAIEIDGRVRGYVNPIGAVTGRMTHSKPNMAQVPASYSPYGTECRQLWTVPSGYKLVGMDASGLELRMLAHYMNDYDYTEEVISGDIHTTNQKSAGLATRDQAKTFIYAFLYGAGDEKIGTIVGGGKGTGRTIKKKFLDNTPALKSLRERVTTASKRGYLVGIDGRRIWVRSEHSALNTLLQGAGAIIMKKALVLLDEYAILKGIDYKIIGNIHDEIQSEVHQKDAKVFGEIAVMAIKEAGEKFNLNCPLDGAYKIGGNWNETH